MEVEPIKIGLLIIEEIIELFFLLFLVFIYQYWNAKYLFNKLHMERLTLNRNLKGGQKKHRRNSTWNEYASEYNKFISEKNKPTSHNENKN